MDDTDLNEIEDINTMEGTISQMKANSQAHKETINHWGSKMGTTSLDIEMLEKKCVKFEKISLGERIDLDELENKCITESDDVAVEKYAKSTIHGDNGRVAKRAESLRSLKMEAMNKTARSNGLSAEYQPWMPSVVTQNPEAAVRPKKRAQLQNISTVKNTGEIMSSTPIALGLMIGTSGATFESSKVTLPVENSKDQISVCRPLASLLKEHQIDGVKFCWKNVCSKIMNPKGEGQSDTHGCILAHNMGLGG